MGEIEYQNDMSALFPSSHDKPAPSGNVQAKAVHHTQGIIMAKPESFNMQTRAMHHQQVEHHSPSHVGSMLGLSLFGVFALVLLGVFIKAFIEDWKTGEAGELLSGAGMYFMMFLFACGGAEAFRGF